jgi:hypothetical protein
MLKDEIGESALRVKAVKFGLPLTEIAPQHDITFYLPDKEKFKSPLIINTKSRYNSQMFSYS